MAMLTQQRHEEILRRLQENGSVSVTELTAIDMQLLRCLLNRVIYRSQVAASI